ncbi:MAG: peptidoglycan D,D-transpeptidase FtsI family protein [Planctomycetota bacterium]
MTLGYRQRVGLLLVVAAGGGLLLLVRLVALQAVQHDRWAAMAASHVASWRPVHARRGRILDANGRELARDEAGFDLNVRAAAWRGSLFVCTACEFRRYYELDPSERSEPSARRCPRCRHKEPTLLFADQRERSQAAYLLGVAPADLLKRIDKRVGEADKAVENALEKLSDKLRRKSERMLWADFGWRSRRIARDVPYEVAREVELHPNRNPAFRIEAVPTRRTPGGREFVHIVGRVQQVRESEAPPEGAAEWLTVTKGRSGLEARFEPELHGEPGWVKLQREPRERQRKVLERHLPIPGFDVRLTIATADQKSALHALHNTHGAFVVIDAATGAVLALVSAPSYEPDDYGRLWARMNEQRKRHKGGRWPRHHALKEAACRDFYAPGSVMKPITAVAALTAGIAEPSTSVVCEKFFTNRRGQPLSVMRCNGTHGPMDLEGALVRSCNIYFQTLMRTMVDEELFPHYAATAHRFGFGRRTGLEIEPQRFTDTFGLGTTWAEWILCSVGQGQIQVSPAQLARAYAGLATGELPELHLVARVGDRPAEVRRTPLGVPASVLEPIRAALRKVPRTGTARGYGLERWRIACKTGTAERRGGNNAWMAGFAPAQARRPAIAFAMVVLQTTGHGGDVCGPRLAEFFSNFYAEAAE